MKNNVSKILSIDEELKYEPYIKTFVDHSNLPNNRYLSWEHCFLKFQYFIGGEEPSDKDTDDLALNLGFYLASWGMMRGSSFLLKLDYKIHIGIVEIILKKEYCSLNNLDPKDYNNDNITSLMKLRKEIGEYYKKFLTINVEYAKLLPKTDRELSDTLITKILLGTLGCTLAYDQYVKAALVSKNIGMDFNEKNLYKLNQYAIVNHDILINIQKNININIQKNININIQKNINRPVTYPIAKIIDMHFFGLGYDIVEKKKKNPNH